jgi:rhodanese-related sulfurtransferase
VFVTDEQTDHDELVRQCNNIGHDQIAGVLDGGVDAWIAQGMPTSSFAVVSADRVTTSLIDVRTEAEFGSGHIPGARNIDLVSIAEHAAEIDQPVSLMCGHGERAATAASILARHGVADVSIVIGGPAEWAAASGLALAGDS